MPPFFQSLSAKTLQPPPAPSRKPSQRLQRPSKDLDDFISSDLENSFASSMSLTSPPGSPKKDTFAPSSLSDVQSPNAMDISPARSVKVFSENAPESRPGRQCVTAARSFGRELGNHLLSASHVESASTRPNGKGLQRAPLPSEWLADLEQEKAEDTPPDEQEVKFSDAMDVDDCILPEELTRPTVDEPTVKVTLSQGTKGFSNLFFDGTSSPPPIRPKKHRSISPEGSPQQEGGLRQRYCNDAEALSKASFEEPSSPAPSSPSARKFGRVASTGGLFGKTSKEPTFLTAQAGMALISDGSKHSKRPAFATRNGYIQSAYNTLEANDEGFLDHRSSRRAFSTTIPPMPSSPGDGESEGLELSSPAAHALAKKQAVRIIRRRDGSEDLRPSATVGAFHQHTKPVVQSPLRSEGPATMMESPSARWLKGTGIPGFGDNEAHGKVLPCEKVSEDGLMRIDVQTLDALISGAYDDKISSFLIIDCRFDYEYEGGHIKGAVNINTTAEIEEFLLGANALKPTPSCSGDLCKKTVLVFHCEFSAKRAPTFAKHLRGKDRAMNNHVYPRIHYPEVYVLKGGYYQYFTESAIYCNPHGYIQMDDPQFARDRRQDLDQFRTKSRFGRTRSYAYGELSKANGSSGQQQPPNLFSHHQRNSAPGPASLMPSAGISRSRLAAEEAAPYLSTLEEDSMCGMTSVSSDESGILEGVEKSPCPPPVARTKSGLMGISMLNAKRNSINTSRGPLQRAQTVAQIR